MICLGSEVSISGCENEGIAYGTKGIILEKQDDSAKVQIDSLERQIPISKLTANYSKMIKRLADNSLDRPLDFILAIDANRLLAEYEYNPYVLASSTKIDIFPHQIDEVVWGLKRDRFMIADEVGLGKTITAALIACELKSRGLADRTLYVVPKSLLVKWQNELSNRFDTKLTVLDLNYLKKYDGVPFSKEQYDYVTSMDFLKWEDRYNLIKERIDLVIVDEAHKFRSGAERRFELGKVLSSRAESMLFLTATPHDGNKEDFLSRLRLLDPYLPNAESASYLYKRHVKENAIDINGKEVFPKRHSRTVNVLLTNKERRINEMISSYVRRRYESVVSPKDARGLQFLAVILKKRAASSFESLRKTLERRFAKLGIKLEEYEIERTEGALDATSEHDSDYGKPDEEGEDGDYEERIKNNEGIYLGGSIEQERKEIRSIINEIDKLGGADTKFDELLKSIKAAKSSDSAAKLIIFTEYRDTLSYLDDRLSKEYETRQIHGLMNTQERMNALDKFASEDADILLCTDAAGEGIDMQFCNVEFNYDIPWNPNKLEQRMGRIHRIGQKREVYYYNFIVDKDISIDGYILNKIMAKIENMIDTMGKDSIFDIIGTIIDEKAIRQMYIELLNSPRQAWDAKMKKTLDEIEKTMQRIKEQAGDLLIGSKLDQAVLNDIEKLKADSLGPDEVKRFLEVWTELNGGSFNEAGKRARIRLPQKFLHVTDSGMLEGTFDGKTAMKKGWKYLDLGNRDIQSILKHTSTDRPVAILRHRSKKGLLLALKISILDGMDREQNSKIVTLFHNEDGAITVDARSVWSYEDPGQNCSVDSHLLDSSLKRLEAKADEISAKFHQDTRKKTETVKEKTKDMADQHAASQIEKERIKQKEYRQREHASSHMSKLISESESKITSIKKKRRQDLEKIEAKFKTRMVLDVIGIAQVIPELNHNERMEVDRKGMKLVTEYERRLAGGDPDKLKKIIDVSERDAGYDMQSFDNKCIEVKSFSSTGKPTLTGHEWKTALRLEDDYWLYVVENVFDDEKSPEDRIMAWKNPPKALADYFKVVEKADYDHELDLPRLKKEIR